MLKVFLDSPAFLKFINRDHPQHSATIEALEHLGRTGSYLYTSLQVMQDVHEYTLSNLGSSLAKTWLKTLPASSLTIAKFNTRDEKQAIALLQEPPNYNLILKDALHIALMRRLGIKHTLSDNPLFPQNRITLLGH